MRNPSGLNSGATVKRGVITFLIEDTFLNLVLHMDSKYHSIFHNIGIFHLPRLSFRHRAGSHINFKIPSWK